jgi:uncharacterized cupredoxin-like copper-binding protein
LTEPTRGRASSVGRRPGVWVVASLVLAATALPGGLAAAHLVRTAPLVGVARSVTATNASFAMNLTDAPAYVPRYLNATVSGTVNVSVDLHNTGSVTHTFTVVNASNSSTVLNRSLTPQALTAYFAAYPPSENVSVAGGKSAWANFSFPASSSFRSLEFVSTIPYQFQAGMWGFLNLTPKGPTVVLTENATDSLSFVPNVLSAGPTVHGPVTLDILLVDLGSISHTFTVAPQPNVTLTTIGYFASHPPLANQSLGPSPPKPIWANFTVPSVGIYEYVCTITGHFAAGMYGFLYVGVPVPPPPPTPSTAIVAIPILVGSAVLLGVGVVLALGTAYLGRLPKKPPAGGPHP